MDEKYPQRGSTHTNLQTQIGGKPTCLPGKPWSPRGLDSLRKRTIPLTVWAVCYVCLESTEEALGVRFLHFIANTLLRRTPVCSDVPLEP